MISVIAAFMIVALTSLAAMADEKTLQEYAEREATKVKDQSVLNEHSPDEYAKVLATAARTGESPPSWVKEFGAALDRKLKTDPISIDDIIRTNPKSASRGIFDDGYKNAIADAAGKPAAQLPARLLDQEQLLRIAAVATLLLCLVALYFGLPRHRLLALTAPNEGKLISRFEILLLWIGGVWAILVFAEADILPYEIQKNFAKGTFIGWVPLALIAITRRFWR
ncbi:MAG: hypothetical protein EXR70_16670 [Deltaproteobacteria bacterium]|nr:hypothetical protein [Deltaproteobacteria bacterium]